MKTAVLCRGYGISNATLYNWKAKSIRQSIYFHPKTAEKI
jgi:hypothetical protein